MAKSKAYWAARAAEREQAAYLRGSALSRRLFLEYQRSTRELMQAISAFYGRYGDKYGLSYQEAVKRLSRREAREWRASLGDYVAQIQAAADPARKKELTAGPGRPFCQQPDFPLGGSAGGQRLSNGGAV